MVDLKWLRDNVDIAATGYRAKGYTADIPRILALDEEKRALQQRVEKVAAEKNAATKEIPKLSGDARAKRLAALKKLDMDSDADRTRLTAVTEELDALVWKLPNLPLPDVPQGSGEQDNVEIRRVGKQPTFAFAPKDHVALGTVLGLIDTARAAKVAGARFTYLLGPAVQLQHALTNFVFALLTNRDTLSRIIADAGLDVPATPFIPVIPPLMLTPDVFDKMARLHPREERYHIPSDDLYLIGSAEHTLGPLHMDEILPEALLPLRYVAVTPSFRREAGSYGKDTRGILRLHQFDKVEMESFTVPEQSVAEQNFFVAIQEHIVRSLNIPYRVVQMCTGDMGAPDARQIDIECWMPGQNAYRETHTADLMTDYQARRLNTRIRRADETMVHAHMNDATALAMGRILIAILENFQQADGSVVVPEVLRPWMGGMSVMTAA